MYDKAKTIIDLEEYQDMKSLIAQLQAPTTDGELSPAELQDATGLLLLRTLENPRLFQAMPGEVTIGKYKAIFVWLNQSATGRSGIEVKVKLVRT